MNDKYLKKFAIFCIVFGFFAGRSDAAYMGASDSSFRSFGTLANQGIKSGKLNFDSTMAEIDLFISNHYSDIYPELCKAALDGPVVLALKNPKRVGRNVMVIGFTEETKLHPSANDGNQFPGNGRFVFYWERDYWDNKLLRVSLHKDYKFEELAETYTIDFDDAVPFSFPELTKLVAKGPPPIRIPPPSAAPPLPDAILNQQADKNPTTQTGKTRPSRGVEGFPWLIGVGIAAAAVILTAIFVAVYRATHKPGGGRTPD